MNQEDIEGEDMTVLAFLSVDTLNPEFMEKKLDAAMKVNQFDVTTLDRNKLLEIIAESIDPMLAKQVIMDKQTAQQKEIDDEQNSCVED